MSATPEQPADRDSEGQEEVESFWRRRNRIRTEMGGLERIEAIHASGSRTVRERIDALLDRDSFEEIGTFAHSAVPADAAQTPGDGKIGGRGTIEGRPVTVAGDDVTVKRGSSALVGAKKVKRLFEQAMRGGQPFVYIGETGGARVPDNIGSRTFSQLPPSPEMASRRRQIPMATAIVGQSFGGSSFMAALSDLVVQVDGSCMAVTSPRVIEAAIGEEVSMEELGGVEVSASVTGQIDLNVATDEEAFEAIRRFLSYLPSRAGEAPPLVPPAQALFPDPAIEEVVPRRANRGYDMLRLLRLLVDDGRLLELKSRFGRSLVTGLARIDGHAVGVIASQPKYHAGALTPEACDKAVRLCCLCDAFGLPIVLLQDTPGFMVGKGVEHRRILSKSMMFAEALVNANVPKLSVVVRKAFGLAYFSMGGPRMGVDYVCAWPDSEIGFMAPRVGANVLGSSDESEMVRATGPMEPAGIMELDEVIDPADTRLLLARNLDRLAHIVRNPQRERPLATWPTSW